MRCEGLAGAWLLLIEGDVLASDQGTVRIRASSRYALRFWPKEEGVNDDDWFCAPRRRFCFGEVEFTDWRGKVQPGGKLEGSVEQAFPSRLGIPLGTLQLIEDLCTF